VLSVIVIVLILAVAVRALSAGFAAVVLGIQLAERRKGLPSSSGRRADVFARRVLRADVSPHDLVHR
jgi:hypothetical protein